MSTRTIYPTALFVLLLQGCKNWEAVQNDTAAWPAGAMLLGIFLILGGMSATEKSGFGGALIVLMGLLMVIVG